MNGVLRTALVGLVVLGCRIEFVGPEAAAQYRVVVSFSDSSAVATSIVATLRPGTDSVGLIMRDISPVRQIGFPA